METLFSSLAPNKLTRTLKANTKDEACYLLAVAGGSGSGKTFFARALQSLLGPDRCQVLSQDNYYFDQSKKFDYDGGSVNFDHPSAIEFELLAQHLRQLKAGHSIEVPIYDFASHSRKNEVIHLTPSQVIIIDGILILQNESCRQVFDHCVYFDTPEDLRLSRRLERDVRERGRDPEGIKRQFYTQVKPMHDFFVEPSQLHAQTIVKDQSDFEMILKAAELTFQKLITTQASLSAN